MTKSMQSPADLGLQVREYLDGSEAKQIALRQRIWKDRSAKGPVLPKDPFRFPLKAPNGDYSAIVTPEVDGVPTYIPTHLQPFKESMFVNTNTHTIFTLNPPDGEGKPGLKVRSDRSPVKYRGTMVSDTANRLPSEIVIKQDTRLAHVFNAPKEHVPGPGAIMWEQALGGQSLGPYYYLTKSSVSRSPGRDPKRPSQAFTAKRRPDPSTLIKSAAPDAVYSTAAPNYDTWLSSGFATTSNLRDIKAETWGRNPREPRDPHAAPGPKEFPVLGKCGHPYDISAKARPCTDHRKCEEVKPAQHLPKQCHSRGVHTAPANPSFGRQNAAMMMRHPGREVRPGTRSIIHSPYTHPEEMGPGASFPLVDFNASLHAVRAARANSKRYCGGGSNARVHTQAVREVQELKWQVWQQHAHAQQSASRAFPRPSSTRQTPAGSVVPPEVRRMEVLRRVGLCTA